MKMRKLNWFNCRNGRDKSRLIRRTVAAMKKMVIAIQSKMAGTGTIHPLFKSRFDCVEVARFKPYGAAFIYVYPSGGIKECDRIHGHYFWRWLEERQLPEIIERYKIAPAQIEKIIEKFKKAE